jgi:hypothetical protein
MDLRENHNGSRVSTQIMLGGNGQNRQLGNPMELCVMLNAPVEASTASRNFQSKVESHQHLIDSPTNAWTKQHPQLPPISMGPCQSRPSHQLQHISSEPRESVQHQPRQHDRPPSINPSLLQALESLSDYPATFHTLYNNRYPTPPSFASRPIHNSLNHSRHFSKSFLADQQQDRHYPSSTSRASLSHRQRAQEGFRVRDTPPLPPHAYSRQRVVRSNPYHNSPPTPNVYPIRSNKPHSNKPYTQEQVHFIRYQREDCGQTGQTGQTPWPDVLILFLEQFPEYQNLELSNSSLSSRYYRDNKVPKLDKEGELALDNKKRVIMIPCKVRGRGTEGKHIPFLFVDMYPDIALSYNWVKLEDKEKARRILQDLEKEVKGMGISGMFLLRSWTRKGADH